MHGLNRRTFGNIAHLVLAHRLESLPLEFAFEFRRNAKEVDGEREDTNDASGDGEELCCGHGRMLWRL